MVVNIATVFLISLVELWLAIPVGFGMGLNPIIIGITAALGSIAGTIAAIFTGGWLRKIVLHGKDPKNQKGLTAWVVKKGIIGMGLLGPLLIGATFTGAIGAAIGMNRRKLVISMIAGIVIWTIITVILGTMGLSLLR